MQTTNGMVGETDGHVRNGAHDGDHDEGRTRVTSVGGMGRSSSSASAGLGDRGSEPGVGTGSGGVDRLNESPWTLLKQAAGTPRQMAQKLHRLTRAISAYGDTPEIDARLRRLQSLGHIEILPNRVQLVVGAIDMLRFWIVPCADDYYRERGIDMTFHQILRFLDEPASLVDPTGFLSERDGIIGHLMQVVHANPCYDLQLLESHENGLEELETQVLEMLAGTHPRAQSIRAIVEEADYHQRLLAYTREYRRSRDADAPLRDNVAKNPKFANIERTFGTLPGAMTYFSRLPSTPLMGAIHVLGVKEFPQYLAAR